MAPGSESALGCLSHQERVTADMRWGAGCPGHQPSLIHLFICLPGNLPVCLSFCLVFIYLSIYLCLSFHPSPVSVCQSCPQPSLAHLLPEGILMLPRAPLDSLLPPTASKTPSWPRNSPAPDAALQRILQSRTVITHSLGAPAPPRSSANVS